MEEIDYQKYYLIKGNIVYKIIIGKTNDSIFIKYKQYIIQFNQKEFTTLTAMELNSIDDSYNLIINIFDENKAKIQNISVKKNLKLIIEINGNDIEIELLYNFQNNLIPDKIKTIKKELKELKEENKKLKKEIMNLKEMLKKQKDKKVDLVKFGKIPNDNTYSYANGKTNNSFIVFKSINENLYLIYSNMDKSIICFDLMNFETIKEIKNYHNEYITYFNHYLDKEKKRDLIMSISEEDNNIRIWNINNWECILNINKINRDGILASGCFLLYNYEICILSCSSEYESIKVFNLNGKKMTEINNSDEPTYFIDTYFDNLLSKEFIITGNAGYVKSYIINKNKIYYKYDDNGSMFTSYAHYHIIVK